MTDNVSISWKSGFKRSILELQIPCPKCGIDLKGSFIATEPCTRTFCSSCRQQIQSNFIDRLVTSSYMYGFEQCQKETWKYNIIRWITRMKNIVLKGIGSKKIDS